MMLDLLDLTMSEEDIGDFVASDSLPQITWGSISSSSSPCPQSAAVRASFLFPFWGAPQKVHWCWCLAWPTFRCICTSTFSAISHLFCFQFLFRLLPGGLPLSFLTPPACLKYEIRPLQFSSIQLACLLIALVTHKHHWESLKTALHLKYHLGKIN